ncbi:MAG: hypothetical protein Q7L07_18680, partial [Pseudohongiella sp.]|nr:hypothetical protein [Pseudohongiella sp.]
FAKYWACRQRNTKSSLPGLEQPSIDIYIIEHHDPVKFYTVVSLVLCAQLLQKPCSPCVIARKR